MPPAKRVRVVARNTEPVPVLLTMRNPGVYTLYVTSSPRWVGRETHLKKSDQPINLASFCIPEKLFLTKDGDPLVDEVKCDQVRFGGHGFVSMWRSVGCSRIAPRVCMCARACVFRDWVIAIWRSRWLGEC